MKEEKQETAWRTDEGDDDTRQQFDGREPDGKRSNGKDFGRSEEYR